jgi:membrane-bound lytic murein transglycosylase D
MRILVALLFAAVFPLAAQTPQVPHKMEFAGITLTIRDDARREIQKDVDALTQSPKHYTIKAERARSYFPIIEKIFAEEQLPDDFKYLALQESALIADAVSTSNAVGFWQFKDFTAVEMGLRVDRHVDERLNIASSSRAAARYIKKNNTFFDNWIYALQAYQMGAGGVMRSVSDTQAGASSMEITSKTYWYVKKFLAHKIAYEPAVIGKGQVELIAYPNSNGKSLRQIAKEVGVDEAQLISYNKWTKSGDVPNDRTYVVAVPVMNAGTVSMPVFASNDSNDKTVKPSPQSPAIKIQTEKKRINSVWAIKAGEGETASVLAARADIDLAKFLKYNEMSAAQTLRSGEYYFLGKKRGRATENFHKVLPGEDLWQISQRYGVQLKRLQRFNRIKGSVIVPAGQTIYLASMRPQTDNLKEPVNTPVVVDNSDTFNWTAGNESKIVKSDTVEIPATTVVTSISESTSSGVSSSPAFEEVQVETVQQEPKQESTMPAEVKVIDTIETRDEEIVKPLPTVKKTEHVVQAKETFYSIAKLYNMGVMELVQLNNLDLQQGLKIGQVLKLSESQPLTEVSASVSSKEVLHEVKSSDTLYSIARQYGVTIKDLMDWNAKKDFSLAVGEKLKIQQRQ